MRVDRPRNELGEMELNEFDARDLSKSVDTYTLPQDRIQVVQLSEHGE